jgi:superoxide dismutase
MPTYTLPDLLYDYGALEPHICGRIMELHHDKHHASERRDVLVLSSTARLTHYGRHYCPPVEQRTSRSRPNDVNRARAHDLSRK